MGHAVELQAGKTEQAQVPTIRQLSTNVLAMLSQDKRASPSEETPAKATRLGVQMLQKNMY